MCRFRVVFVSPERAVSFKSELKRLVRASWLLLAGRSVLIVGADFRCMLLADAGVVIPHMLRLADAGVVIPHMLRLADAAVIHRD